MEKKQHKQSSKRPSFSKILIKSSLAFLSMTPMLLGVIGLVGLFQILVTPKMIATLFGDNLLLDIFIGTLSGATGSGNPVISYLIGGEMLGQGVSLYAVSAFILSWVTLGFVQLPAEIEVFGTRFTLYRNILAFFFTMFIAVLTTFTVQVLS